MRSISLVPLLWLNWWSWLLWRGLLPCLRLLLLGITSLLTIRSSTPLCLAISINRWASQGRSSSHCHIWLVHFCTICESALRRWPLLGLNSGPAWREKLPMSCLCLLNCLDISKEINKLPTPLCTLAIHLCCVQTAALRKQLILQSNWSTLQTNALIARIVPRAKWKTLTLESRHFRYTDDDKGSPYDITLGTSSSESTIWDKRHQQHICKLVN